jgi:hypothetical protein
MSRRQIMKKHARTVLKTTLATSLAVVATGSAGVMAAGPYTFVGSDTLTEVVRDSITQSSSALIYNNTGSGAAEKALLAAIPTQRIAPMSRNFTQDLVGNAYSTPAVVGSHPGWAPKLKNIIGLDAAVMVEKAVASNYSACPDVAAALDPDTVNFPHHAEVNTMLGLILGGKDGLGDTASCSHPDRLAALDSLAGCFSGIVTGYIEHFYRRDDRSGTADTMKEKLRIKRFCSGRAPGLVANLDNNMANDDSDPIRRKCIGAGSSYAQTPCTLYPATTPCTAGQAGCTQGLVVALSQSDPSMPDITTSIARRVRLDNNNSTVGFAGREAARQTGNTNPTLSGIGSSDYNTRTNNYLLSRRLFINWSDKLVGTGRLNADDIAQEAQEEALFDWMTNTDAGNGRFNVDPILVAHGFLPCTDDFTDPQGSGNLCSVQVPPPPAETTPKQCIPAGALGNGSDICCADPTIASTNNVACPAFPCAKLNSACTGSGRGNCCVADATTCTDQGDGNFACN